MSGFFAHQRQGLVRHTLGFIGIHQPGQRFQIGRSFFVELAEQVFGFAITPLSQGDDPELHFYLGGVLGVAGQLLGFGLGGAVGMRSRKADHAKQARVGIIRLNRQSGIGMLEDAGIVFAQQIHSG